MNNVEVFSNEQAQLEKYAANYITSDDSSQQRLMRELEIRVLKAFLQRGKVLELGCEIGYMSELLSPLVDRLDIVDASSEFLNRTRKRGLANAQYFCSLFEEFNPPCLYDCVVASHVLEHLLDVQSVLKIIHAALGENGLLFVAVPNARALSRQLARHMGLIDDLYALTPNDLRGGHRRVYDRVTLNRELEIAGFEIVSQGGIFFKYLADFQMDQMIDTGILGEQQLEGLFSLGNEYPDMCADVYAIVRKRVT